jgi:hypothetical protein
MGDMTHRGLVIVALAYCLVLLKASYANVQISGNNCNLSQNGYGAERAARAFLVVIMLDQNIYFELHFAFPETFEGPTDGFHSDPQSNTKPMKLNYTSNLPYGL